MPGRSQGRTWSPAAEIYAAGLFFAYILLLFLHGAPPHLTNYANWTYQGVLLRGHLIGIADPTHQLKPYPVPNSAATIGIGLLNLMLPWVVAAKVWLGAQLATSFLCLRHFMRTTGSGSAPWFIVPQSLFLNVSFWYGFMNFNLGLCWVLLIASLLLRRSAEPEGAWTRDIGIGLLLLLAFFTHMIPFSFATLLVLLYAVQTGRGRIVWQVFPAALLTLWYVLGRYIVSANADAEVGMTAAARLYSARFWGTKVNSLLKSFGLVNLGTTDSSIDITLWGRSLFVILILTNLVVCIVLTWRMIVAARDAYKRRSADRFLWTSVLLILPVYLLLPGTALGVTDFGSRLLQVGLSVALVLGLSRWRMRAMGKASIAASVVLTGAGLCLFSLVAMRPPIRPSRGLPLPAVITGFAHVPVYDQDGYYRALESGDLKLAVFPTGMFVNAEVKPPR